MRSSKKKRPDIIGAAQPNHASSVALGISGSKILYGERPKDAIAREIMEELDIVVLAGLALEAVIWKYPGKQICLMPIICEIRSGEIILHEHLDYQWLTTQEIARMNLLPPDRAILIQLKKEP